MSQSVLDESAWPGTPQYPRDPESGMIDMVPAFRRGGLTIWANHCPGCGRWARTVAGDNSAKTYWCRTDCKKCGVRLVVGLDSRPGL